MTSVTPINSLLNHNGDTTAKDKVNSAKLDSNLAELLNKLNALIDSLNVTTRDDDQLKDAIVLIRNMHPEVLVYLGANGVTPEDLVSSINQSTEKILGSQVDLDGDDLVDLINSSSETINSERVELAGDLRRSFRIQASSITAS